MLTGRESLIRLIGKRRRKIPNRHSILSTTTQTSLNLCNDGNGGEEPSGEDVVETSVSDWVDCPVCGNKVRGEAQIINSHLDSCLARGTKRKLGQRTLLQLNFCSGSRIKIHTTESESSGTKVAHSITDKNAILGTLSSLGDPVAEEFDSVQGKLTTNSAYAMYTPGTGSTKNVVNDEIINYSIKSFPLLGESEVHKNGTAAETMDNISRMLLATSIVGRRFGEKVEFNPGAIISLLRDPDNAKDPNAIKVLTADCGCSKVVGFLPRELAKYLSPLIDEFGLSFEGCITSVPQHALAVVPIEIVCQNKIFGEKECKNYQVAKSLWAHALLAVEHAKNYPPSMTKYQENFVLLLQEVLRNNSYLLTDDEKTFLETFISFSDDSQRLFVRLYTRKGPWFRMSNISYSEINDCQLAVKGLSAAGYVCLIESKNDILKNDLEEILNTLTVGELREILYIINKNVKRGLKKEDLIALLLSSYQDGLCPFLQSVILEKTGVYVRISSTAESLIWRAERLFFLNGEQDLSAFLLVDLGIVKFPTYNCIISDQIFSCRSDLLSYEEAIEVAQIMDQSLDENNSELVLRCIEISATRISNSSVTTIESSTSKSMVPLLSCFSASWVYSKVVLLGVSFLEHESRYGVLKNSSILNLNANSCAELLSPNLSIDFLCFN